MRKEPVRPTPSCAQQQTYYWGDTKLFIQSHEPVCVCFVQAEIQDQEQRLYFMIMSIEICNLWRRSNASFKWGELKKAKCLPCVSRTLSSTVWGTDLCRVLQTWMGVRKTSCILDFVQWLLTDGPFVSQILLSTQTNMFAFEFKQTSKYVSEGFRL